MYSTIDMNIQDSGMHYFVSSSMISLILYIKNGINNLYKVLKHIESALSNGGGIIFIAISL